ncbi:MAG: hypothetical protein ACFFFT_00270 [Candidatus Thorarchaeota archaeon]
MSYSHRTNHAFSPDMEFWRSIEIFIEAFPYKQGNKKSLMEDEYITYYERRYNERFDVDFNDSDVYGKSLSRKFIWNLNQRIYLDEMDPVQRQNIDIGRIRRENNYTGRVVKFLSNSITNPNNVYKFEHYFESAYYYLVEILNLNPDLPIIRHHGLDDQNNAQFQVRWDSFQVANGGLLQPNEFVNEFNRVCRAHSVPFVMCVFNDDCYVIHTTDIFVEKTIQEIPLFLTDPDLQGANHLFIQAYVLRSEGNYKDCLAKAREGLEAVRDCIYDRYNLPKSRSVHNDYKRLFTNHVSTVFDFTKIPEDNSSELKKIVEYLKCTVLLTVKMGNFGHHTLSRPQLLEESTAIFTLGLVASVIPFIFYLLK